jgi:arsenite-transporting ATPase
MNRTRALIVTGAGGVGKTTVAAALAVSAANNGLRTLVVTVDPARRLAAAIGTELGAEPSPHPEQSNLWAAMLDATSSWQAVARRHAAPEVADRLVHSKFFTAAAAHFPASQSYAAAEEATTYLDAKVWDLVVVDTPPAAGGLDFFAAPAQMADLVGGRLLRWLTGGRLPGRRFFFDRAGRPVLRLAGSILGSTLFEEVAEFLMDLRTAYDGVARRAEEIDAHMRDAGILVVTTADPAPIREAIRFFRDLTEAEQRPAAVVFNRTLPARWAGAVADPRTNRELVQNLENWGAEARRQQDARIEFASRYRTVLATIPWQPLPPTDLESLADLIKGSEGLPLVELGVER